MGFFHFNKSFFFYIILRPIGYNEEEETERMKRTRNNYYAYVNFIDPAASSAVTPSYRLLPADVPVPPCSGRY